MKYEMSVKDRLAFMQVLPREGNFLLMKLRDDLVKQLDFNEKEQEDIGFNSVGDQIMWDSEKAKKYVKEIEYGKPTKDMLKKQVGKLDKQNAITMDIFPIVEKYDLLPEEEKKEE